MLLYPQPQSVSFERSGGSTPKETRCYFEIPPPNRLTLAVHALGFTCVSQAKDCNLTINSKDPFKPEGHYSLSRERKLTKILSSSESATFYALRTYRQLLDSSPEFLHNFKIDDWPDRPNRGYMLDISRCKVPTQQSLFELVDLLASLKYNQLQLYTEHTFAYQAHTEVWKNASPITADEIRELDQYCHDRYIELVPNQNSFGHMERWLKHDKYKHLAESPDGFEHPIAGWKPVGSTLKPSNKSIKFVDSLFEELLPNFASRKLNIGGDEPWELGQGFSKETVKQKGKTRVYLDHLLKIYDRVSSRGYSMQFWGDIIIEEPELAKELPKDVTALLWGYEAGHPFDKQAEAMVNADTPFYVVPGTSTWNSIGGRMRNAFQNIDEAMSAGSKHRAKGYLLTEWGDNGHHQSHRLGIPPLIYAAGAGWNHKGTDRFDIQAVAEQLLESSLPKSEYETIEQFCAISFCFKKHLHNGTWLNKILFSKPEQSKELRNELVKDELEHAKESIDAISANGELELAKHLLEFAANKGLHLLNGQSTQSLPQELEQSFRFYWLERNRVGGLEESVAYLRNANP